MGYQSIYSARTISRLTEYEVKYLDRLFMKGMVDTQFFQKFKLKGHIQGIDIDRIRCAETFYQQAGLYVFGDNKFAFRNFSDTKEYKMSLDDLKKSPLWTPSDIIRDKLSNSIDKALIEVEKRCQNKGNEFRNGAWQLYSKVQEHVSDIVPYFRDRRTIKRALKNENI